MKTKFSFLLFGFLLINTKLFGQNDLDSIFFDKKRLNTFYIGSDIIQTIFGTPNIRTSYKLSNEKFLINLELGSPLFGYRIRPGFQFLETEIDGGIEFNTSFCFRSFEGFQSEGSNMYFGVEFEHWKYDSQNLNIASETGFVPKNDVAFESEYGYFLDPNYTFKYNHRISRFGILFGVNIAPRKKTQIDIFVHTGIERKSSKFLSNKSSGVSWDPQEPIGYNFGYLGGISGYLRLSLTLKFKLPL